MKVDHNTTLEAIQNAFSKQFSHLRIEFYNKPHEPGTGSLEREKLNPEFTLNEVSKSDAVTALTFDGSMKISDFETLLHKELGLNAQVFRKSANLWLQTTTTDNWTLDKANEKGRRSEELAKEIHEDEPEESGQEFE